MSAIAERHLQYQSVHEANCRFKFIIVEICGKKRTFVA